MKNVIVLGGSWNDRAYYCRSAFRSNLNPAYAFYVFVGLRVVIRGRK